MKDQMVKMNENIESDIIRVIDNEGTQLGVMKLQDGLHYARKVDMDLVEVSPQAHPPVCKIVDWGRYQFESKKKAKLARSKQVVIETKELQLRPNIDEHDLQVKLRNARKFLDKGKHVRFFMKFRGREVTHVEIGMEKMKRILIDLENIIIEKEPIQSGNNIIMVVSPGKVIIETNK